MLLGQPDLAQEHLERSIDLYNPVEDRALCFVYGEDPALAGLNFLSWVLWLRGFASQALIRGQEAIDRSLELGHPLTAGFAYAFAAYVHYFRREPIVAQKVAEAGIAFCAERSVPIFPGALKVVRGWALAEQGHPEEGLQAIGHGIEQWQATGTGLLFSGFCCVRAEVYAKWCRFDDGLSALEEAFDRLRSLGERIWEPELHRLKGVLLLAQSTDNEIEDEARFRKAIEVARSQGSKAFELRAATSLARLLQRQGRRQDARDELAPVAAWFTEGFDTPDLIEAKALLDES
jgi:predicted ATPase